MLPSNRRWFIYVLKDPRTDAVRYVGYTNNLRVRLKTHIQQARNCLYECHKDRWLRALLALNMRPVMKVIEEGEGEGWQSAERRWIAYYKERAKLTNGTIGGEGGLGAIWSDEAKAKLSKTLTGRKRSPEGRASIARANKRRGWTPEQRASIANANRRRWIGARHTATTRARMATAGKARWSRIKAARNSNQRRLFE